MNINLQFKWDMYIISCFYQRPSYTIYSVAKKFQEAHNLTDEAFYALKRVPRLEWYKKLKVCPWMCKALRKLTDVLFNKSIEDSFDIATKLADSCLDSKETEFYKYTKQDHNEWRKDLAAYRSTLSFKAGMNRQYKDAKGLPWL